MQDVETEVFWLQLVTEKVLHFISGFSLNMLRNFTPRNEDEIVFVHLLEAGELFCLTLVKHDKLT